MEEKNLLEICLAKSSGKSIYEHVLDGIKVIEKISNFIRRLPALEILNIEGEKFIEYLIRAYLLHDLGKINIGFQKKLLENIKNETKKEKLIKNLSSIGFPNINIEDHEFLSIFWYPFVIGKILNNEKDIFWKKVALLSVLIHHQNEFYESRIYGILENEMYINNRPNSRKDFIEIWSSQFLDEYKSYLNFLIENFDFIYESLIKSIKKMKDKVNNEISKILSKILKELSEKDDILEELLVFKNLLEDGEVDIEFRESLLFFYDEDLINKLYEEKDGKLIPRKESFIFLLLSGLLKEIDYLASNEDILEEFLKEDKFLLEEDEKELFFNRILEELKEKSKSKYVWQERVLQEKGIMEGILKAPTGSGKTEFSLLAFLKSKKRGLLYNLPIRTALNDLFDKRFPKYFNRETIGILHSTALPKSIEKIKNILKASEEIQKSKLILKPVLLTTPDQILTSSMKFFGFDRFFPFYSNSFIVVDELQLYTPEMLAITLASLKIAKDLGANVLVMTATLPRYMEELVKEYLFSRENEILSLEEGRIFNVLNWEKKRHKFVLKEGFIIDEENQLINGELLEQIKKAKRVNIIVNTVRKAIILYEKLKEMKEYEQLEGYEIFLIHSRMLERVKDKILEEIRKIDEENKPRIVVATQVIEASVDIDSDLLITSFAPIDALIQRFGRVYRQKEIEGDEPNIIVYYLKNEPYLDKHDQRIYINGRENVRRIKENILKRTLRVLKNFEGKKLDFLDELKMVEEVYSSEELKSYKDNIEKFIMQLLTGKIDGFTKEEKQRIFRESVTIPVLIPELVKIDDLDYLPEEEQNIGKIIKENIEEFLSDEGLKNVIQKLGNKFSYDVNDEEIIRKMRIIRKIIVLKNIIPVRFEIFRELYEKYLKGGKIWSGIYIVSIPGIENEDIINKIVELGIDKYTFEKYYRHIPII